jgi:hypothetical protein
VNGKRVWSTPSPTGCIEPIDNVSTSVISSCFTNYYLSLSTTREHYFLAQDNLVSIGDEDQDLVGSSYNSTFMF